LPIRTNKYGVQSKNSCRKFLSRAEEAALLEFFRATEACLIEKGWIQAVAFRFVGAAR
jgi:hypothetical protein